jgi:peroxiredoxin
MKKRILIFVVVLGILLPIWSLADTPGKLLGEHFPDLPLLGTMTDQGKAYLETTAAEDSLRLQDIGTEAVLIEIFSMYCPYCQREAPKVNELYEMLKASDLHPRVRVIGIGAGNSQFEVDFFRQKYDVEFPLFVDPDYIIHKAIGQVGTPYFILVDLKEGEEHDILFTHIGPFEDTKLFFDQLREAMQTKASAKN